MSSPFETSDRIVEMIDELVQEAVGSYYDKHSGESFSTCAVCGKWEDHEPDCFIPAMIAWMSKTPGQ